MASNPDPGRITAALWYFVQSTLAMEPGTQYSGTFADKPGYHNTRNNLLNQGRTNDYSVRLAADKAGPGDKTAAYDWTFPDAQNGRYGTIIKYGQRVRAAFNARDPRLRGWREVLIQADADSNAEGFDFTSWSERTPDSTHLWHGHFSVLRQYLNDFGVMNGMLSILAGESLATWESGRSRYGGNPNSSTGGKEMFTVEYRQPDGGTSYWVSDGLRRRTLLDWDSFIGVDQGDGRPDFTVTSQQALDRLAGPVDSEQGGGAVNVGELAAALASNTAFVQALAAGLSSGLAGGILSEAGKRLQKDGG